MRCAHCCRLGSLLTRKSRGEGLCIWALLGARAGDNDQIIALAEALGLPFTIKQLSYNGLHRLGPRLLRASTASLTAESRKLILSEPPPDLTISGGHRSVPVVQALRQRSGGRTRSVHVGFPRITPANFDLVIATSQYPAADHPKLLRIPFALTAAGVLGHPRAADPLLLALPSPRRLLLVGGPNIYWKLDEQALEARLAALIEDAQRDGGSIIVSTSPRTPPKVEQAMYAALDASPVPTLLAKPKQPPAYPALLAAADSIHVTADSVAMVSDAIWTGKPMALVPVTANSLGKAVASAMSRLRPGKPLYPQDLRSFWRAMAELGIGEDLAQPRISREALLREIVARARAAALPHQRD
jgi:mitochondrial fission protein ELM1